MSEFAPVVLPFVLLLASFAGWAVQHILPDRHRTRDTIDAVRLVLGMLVTFAALVLGLLTSSAKGHFDTHATNLQLFGIDLITLDQRLREYGPPAEPARAELRAYTAAAIADTWPGEPRPTGAYPLHPRAITPGSTESLELGTMLLEIDRMVAALTPGSPLERALVPILQSRMQTTLQDRWVLVGSAQPTLAWPFMGVMTGWLVLVFAIFGLTAPSNRVVHATIAIAALSLSVALWLIMDLDSPVTGLLHVSSAALREALLHMDLPGAGPP